MSDIVTMIADALLLALEGVDGVDVAGKAPIAEYMNEVGDRRCIAIVFPNDPDSEEWSDELDKDSLLAGSVYVTHKPFKRRLTVRVRKYYLQSSREIAAEEFGQIMRGVEYMLCSWTDLVGPDSNGESTSRTCGALVKSTTKYGGGQDSILANGKLWVEFLTS